MTQPTAAPKSAEVFNGQKRLKFTESETSYEKVCFEVYPWQLAIRPSKYSFFFFFFESSVLERQLSQLL